MSVKPWNMGANAWVRGVGNLLVPPGSESKQWNQRFIMERTLGLRF